MTYEDLISEFKTVRYCCHRLIEINEELEVLNHKKTGLARSGPDLTPEQIRSPLPMPHYQPQYHSPLALYEVISSKEAELERFRKRLLDLRWTELLPLADQNILWDLYIYRKHSDDVAYKYGYSKRGMYKHLRQEIRKLC